MTVELAWRRRKREAAERRLAAKRHREQLRAIVAAGGLATPRIPILNGRYVETIEELAVYVAGVVAELDL